MRIFIIFFVSILISISKPAFATHMMGADLTYQHVSGNTYKIILTFYRDCAGVDAPAAPVAHIYNPYKNYKMSLSLTLEGPSKQIIPLCQSATSNSTCNGGTLPGVQEYLYSGIITLPDTCSNWIFSYTDCCRNYAITSLAVSNQAMYIESHLNNTFADNSPVFKERPVIYISDNNISALNYSATDPDGDSLSYAIVEPKATDRLSLVTYNSGLSYKEPFINTFSSFDSTMGIYSVAPLGVQITVAAVLVKEYRKGIYIGSVERDVEIIVSHSNNHLPGINDFGANTSMTFYTCDGDTLLLNLQTIDPDSGQTVAITVDSVPNMNYSIEKGTRPLMHILFNPQKTQVGSAPVIMYVHVSDDNCPIEGKRTYMFIVYIRPCIKDTSKTDKNGAISLFPALAIDRNTLYYTNTTSYIISSITLYDALGKEVNIQDDNPTHIIKITYFSSGAYFAKFNLNNGSSVIKRFVVQR